MPSTQRSPRPRRRRLPATTARCCGAADSGAQTPGRTPGRTRVQLAGALRTNLSQAAGRGQRPLESRQPLLHRAPTGGAASSALLAGGGGWAVGCGRPLRVVEQAGGRGGRRCPARAQLRGTPCLPNMQNRSGFHLTDEGDQRPRVKGSEGPRGTVPLVRVT